MPRPQSGSSAHDGWSRFSGQRADQRPAAGGRELVAADAPGGELAEVVDEPPLQREEAVQQPHVEVLETVVPVARLPGREPQQRTAPFQVGVEGGDVGVGVVEHVVLAPPEERAPADEVQGEGQDRVRPRAGRSASVIRVVHHREADARHGEADRDAQQHRFPCPHVREHQQSVGAAEPREHGGALDAHGPAAVTGARGAFEISLHPALQIGVEGAVRRKPDPRHLGPHTSPDIVIARHCLHAPSIAAAGHRAVIPPYAEIGKRPEDRCLCFDRCRRTTTRKIDRV